MSLVAASQPAPGKRPGKQNRPYFGRWGSPVTPQREPSLWYATVLITASWRGRKTGDSGAAYMPKVAERQLLPAFRCFPPASPAFAPGRGSKKRPRKAALIN